MYEQKFEHKGQYERELEIYLKKFSEEEFKALCTTKIADLSVEYAYSDEPVKYSEMSSLRFKPIKIGEVWAYKNFACAWFHLYGKIDSSVEINDLYLDFCNGGEGLLVDKSGHALKGFTSGSPIFGVMDYTVEKRLYPLKGLTFDDGYVDLYIDGASNGLQGEFPYNTVLSAASIVKRNNELFDLYCDFDVLLNYAGTLAEGSEKKYKFIYALRKVMNLIVYRDENLYEKAKSITTSLFNEYGADKTKVTAIGHAHMDLAWLWPIRETKRKILRNFANAIYLLKKYPEFRFAVSQPQQLQWTKELDPQLYEEIKNYAKDGRIEIVGGGWVENDTNVPCGESLVRQELYGQKFWLEEFGRYVDIRWLPDTFGYSAAMPQIIKKSAQNYFMTIKISWSNRTIFPYHSFIWKGIDGSDVVVHMPPEGTYNSLIDPKGLLFAESQLKENDSKDEFLTVYGIGDGGGGPSEIMLERTLREKHTPYLPKVAHTSVASFYDRLAKKNLSVYSGEMYLEKHRGTYTSQSDNKKFNREAEEKILILEKLFASKAKRGDKEKIDALWKEILLYQFHDILPGSSIKRVYDETSVAYKRILSELEDIVREHGYSYVPDRNSMLVNTENREIIKLVKPADDVWLYFKGKGALIKPTVYEYGDVKVTVDSVETDYFNVKISDDGSLSRIELKNGKRIFDSANRLRVYIDRGDAWDFEDDYRDQPERYMKLLNSFVRDFGDLIEIRQTYAFRCSRLTQKILIHKKEAVIRIYHDVDWNDTGYMVRAEFKPAIWSDVVHSDVQFGYLDRPTTDNTEHERAQFEMCCNKWFDISADDSGFSIINNAKNGFMAKNGEISLNLFRATNYPCEKAEIHSFSYSYAIYLHNDTFNPVVVDDMAADFNSCNLYGNAAIDVPSIDNRCAAVSSFKPAYDGNGFIARVYERTGKAVSVRMKLPEKFKIVCETDLLEDEIGWATEEFELKPFEIKTFRLRYEG